MWLVAINSTNTIFFLSSQLVLRYHHTSNILPCTSPNNGYVYNIYTIHSQNKPTTTASRSTTQHHAAPHSTTQCTFSYSISLKKNISDRLACINTSSNGHWLGTYHYLLSSLFYLSICNLTLSFLFLSLLGCFLGGVQGAPEPS